MNLTAKCCLIQNQNKIKKNGYSCKGISKKHNDLNFELYKDVLDFLQKIGTESGLKREDIDKAKNIGFTVYDQGVVTHKQNKHGLSGYYDKRYVLIDGSQNKIF